MAALRTIDYSQPVEVWRDGVLEIMDACCEGAAQVSAAESAIWYDGLRKQVIGSEMGAFAHSGYSRTANEKSVKAFIGKILEGDYEGFERLCCERLDYEMVNASGKSIEYNSRKDPGRPRYARVPVYGKSQPCDFCVMLASRGPVYHTEASAGAVTKYHAHCKCRIVPVWDSYEVKTENGGTVRRGGTQYEGYDPDALFDEYLDKMLDPDSNFAERMAKAAARAKQRHGKSSTGRPSADVRRDALDKALRDGTAIYRDLYEMGQAVLAAKSYEELADVIKQINKEIGLHYPKESQVEILRDKMLTKRKELIGH